MDFFDSERIQTHYNIESTVELKVKDSEFAFTSKNMPTQSIENNQYFHALADNKEFEAILKQHKVKVTADDFAYMERYFESQLEEAKEMIEKYNKLINKASKKENSRANLMIEIISGTNINTENGKYMPFVEVSQCFPKNPNQKGSMATVSAEPSTRATERFDQLNSIVQKTKSDRNSEFMRASFKNELVMSTSLPIKPNEDGVYEWSKLFNLAIDPILCEKSGSHNTSLESLLRSEKANTHNITINLYRTKRDKFRAQKLGQSRSFYILQFKNQEVNQMVLDFREDYESHSQGKVTIRTQFIQDEILTFNEIINSYNRRCELISQCIDIFDVQRQTFIEENELKKSSRKYQEGNDSEGGS